MNISDRLVGSRSREGVEQFYQTRLVRITHGAFAIWLNPFGILDAKVVVNLFPKLGVGEVLVRHGNGGKDGVGEVLVRHGNGGKEGSELTIDTSRQLDDNETGNHGETVADSIHWSALSRDEPGRPARSDFPR